ncbi:aminotransferase class V-fold PLP-dependent enzyme, partial [Pseudoxanthobacter sp.]|uniref:aminotransferase class V-fold PLP-dependent enzyme n=1 Tax=Pseudoxanthobacter sp. TaxID=1925742 RepID=UPI002FE0EFDE
MTTAIDPAIGSVSDPNYIAGDAFETELISRLANEIYAEDHRGARAPADPAPAPDYGWLEKLIPENLPFPGAVPAPSAPQAVVAVPRAVAAADTLRVAVPDPADAAVVTPSPGPVGAQSAGRPAGLAGGFAPARPPVPGWPDTGGGETFAFGEPRFSPAAGRSLPETPALPASAAAGQGLYFLPQAQPGRVPASVATPDPAPQREVSSFAGQAAGIGLSAFDVQAIRRDFPALHQSVNGRPLIWLDNAATTHKPQSVIDITSTYYSKHNSNIHRAAHTLAARSTDLFEGARDKLRDFIGAGSS